MAETTDLTTLEPAMFGQLVLLTDRQPNHPLVVPPAGGAARLAVGLIDERRGGRAAMIQACQAICGSREARDLAAHTRLACRVRRAARAS